MPQFLDTRDPDFEPRFAALLAQKREADAEVDAEVAAILADVAARGDAAVIEMTARWDRLRLTPATLAFSAAEIDAAVASVGAGGPRGARARGGAHPRLPRAAAARRTRAGPTRPAPSSAGAGRRSTPPASTCRAALASYPSSLLMNAIPARVAGVRAARGLRPHPGRRGQPARAPRRAARRRRHASTASAAPRRSRRSPTAPRRSRRSTRSPAPATPGSPPPSAGSSAASAST